jgi:hypothetical protein
MAVVMTFGSLKTEIAAFVEQSTDAANAPLFVAHLPGFINAGEQRIARELKVQGFLEPVTTTLAVGQSVYDKPDRWKDTVSFNIGTGAGNTNRTPLFTRGYEYVRAYWPNEAATGTPEFYCDYDDSHWLIAPTPDAAYPLEIMFYASPPLLDDVTQTNWLTEKAPRLLRYAALIEAETFLKSDERVATWQALYDREAGMLSGEDLAKILDRNSDRKEA